MAIAMQGSGPVPGGSRPFLEWDEQYVSHDRGSRVVHYFLKDHQGHATLAVVGTERSLRHMVYVVCDEFLPLAGLDKTSTSAFKWRARREVVEWLASLCSKSCRSSPRRLDLLAAVSPHSSDANVEDQDAFQEDDADHTYNSRKQSGTTGDVLWVGASWTCRKRLRHYNSFQRNGITISVRDFVFVMSEEKEHHIAYVEDMYEDKKFRKKLRVRWFHKTKELVCKIPPPAPHPREVFFTQFPQVLSVECVDGLATVLAPEHFEKCSLVFLPEALALIHVCSRQFDNDGIKPLNICEVDGYWHQKALAAIGVSSPREPTPNDDLGSEDMDMDEDELGNVIRRGIRSARYFRRRVGPSDRGHRDIAQDSSCLDADAGNGGISEANMDEQELTFEVGDKVELLCQDSGVRGCWFTGIVTIRISGRLKIRYDELQDEDGKGNLEEWVSTSKFAQADKLGIHPHRRPTIRPCPPASSSSLVCDFGSVVDVWWNDGWWEGIVISRCTANEVRVYFPGEGDTTSFQISDLRVSRDWVNGQWIDVKCNPDAVTALGFGVLCGSKGSGLQNSHSIVLESQKDHSGSELVDGLEQGGATMNKQPDILSIENRKVDKESPVWTVAGDAKFKVKEEEDNDETFLMKNSSELRWKSARKRYRHGDTKCADIPKIKQGIPV